jgi:hypothetical protein
MAQSEGTATATTKQPWEQALQSYKTDAAAAAAEIARAQTVYTTQKAAGNTAAADAAHTWANQIRAATGTAAQYDSVTGAVISPAGQPVTVTPAPTVPTVPAPTPAPVYTMPPVQPFVVQPYQAPAPAAPTGPAVAANQVAQTAYYQASNALANDSTMMTQFLKENPWANPDNNQWDQSTAAAFSNWSDSYVQQISAQSILDGVRFDATKEPWWPSYVDMLTSRDALTKASLKTALDLKVNAAQAQQGMATAEYNFQVSEIDNALNLANWSTKEEMATGNVWMAGALNWAVAQNETQGLNQKNLALQQRGTTIAKLANDITILTSDYANQGTLMDAATIAEIGAKREYFLSGNIDQYNTAMALVKTLQGAREAINIAAPGTVKAGQAAEATATQNQNMQTAAFLAGLVQEGIYLNQNADGTYGYKTGLTADQQLAVNTQLFDQWYNTQGLNFNYAQLASDQTQQQFTNWAATQGLNLDVSKQDWQQFVDQSNITLASEQFSWSKSSEAAQIYGQYGITLTKDSTGKITGMNRVLTPSEKLAIQQTAYDYWYKKQSVAMDWRTLTDNEKQLKFTNWATAQGIQIQRDQLAETIRNHKKTESIDQQNANTAEAGGPGGTNAAVYDPTDDRALVNSANFIPSGAGSAPYLRLGAYSGAMTSTDPALKDFFSGGTAVVTPAVTDAKGKVTTPEVTQAYTGLNAMNQTDAAAIILLIPDDVRAGEAWAMYAAAHNLGTATATFNAYASQNKLTPAQIASGLGFLSQIGGGR